MLATRFALILILGTVLIALATAPPAVAQDQEAWTLPWKTRGAQSSHTASNCAIERRWIADLADLADKSSGPEANDAYRQLFNLAIARDLCFDAQPAAQSCLASIPVRETEPAARTCWASIPSAQDLRALATSVQVFARAEKGRVRTVARRPEGTLQETGLRGAALPRSRTPRQRSPWERPTSSASTGSGRYDVARKLCELACKDDTPAALKDRFEARKARLDLLDKPAPLISGTDVDGRQVSLADLKGKVVLVSFWESWCLIVSCLDHRLNALAQKYHRQGFVILGVNLDARHPDVKDGTTALPTARQFLVRHGVTWINLLDCQRTDNVSTAYGVEEIPANFLIGRDGRILAVEQSGDALERAIVRALGGLSGGHSQVIEYEDQMMEAKSVQVIFNKNRQNVSHDGNAYRFGAITGSRRLSHDIATVEHTGFRFGLCPGAGHSR